MKALETRLGEFINVHFIYKPFMQRTSWNLSRIYRKVYRYSAFLHSNVIFLKDNTKLLKANDFLIRS